MLRRQLLRGILFLVAIQFALTTLTSCKQKPEAPDSSESGSPPAPVSTFNPEAPPFVPQPDPAATAQTTVDPQADATVELPDGAGVAVHPGTTKEPAPLKMARLMNDPGTMGVNGLASSVYELSLGADGKSQPLQPVRVRIPLSKEAQSQAASVNKLAVAYWDGSMWRPTASHVDVANGILHSTIAHFSSVAAVATDRFEPGPGRVILNPPGMGDFSDRRVPRGATAECVILTGPGSNFDAVWIKDLEIADGAGKFKLGSGSVRRWSNGPFNGAAFTVRVPPDAPLGPRDIEMADRSRQRFPGYLTVCSPMVMIIDIDGMRQGVFNDALLHPPTKTGFINGQRYTEPSPYLNIPRMFGPHRACRSGQGLKWEQFRSGVALLETTTVFPSVTFAGHAAIFSGTDLGFLRMAGNEWFDRRISRKYGFTIDLGDTRGSYTGQDYGPLKAGGKGLANERLHASGAKTVYEKAVEQFTYRSVVFHNMYYEGAEWLPYTLATDEGFYYFCPFSTWAETSMADKAKGVIRRNTPDLGVLTLYYAGADHHGHERYWPKDIADRQRNYLCGFPVEAPGSGLLTLPPGADWAFSIDTNFGNVLEALSDVMYKETTYIFTADHGQSGMSVPRDAGDLDKANISCFKTSRSNQGLHKLSDLVFEAGFIPFGTYDIDGEETALAPADANAVVGLNGGMAQIYLRRPKAGTSLPGESIRRTIDEEQLQHAADDFEPWDRPARYQDVLRIAAMLAELQFDQPVPIEHYARSIDLILVRNSEQAQGDWLAMCDYQVYLSPNEQIAVIDYLKSPAGRAWLKAPHMGWSGDDRDAEMIADRIRRLQSFVSGDLLVLPHYPDFYFEYAPINGDHGSLVRNDMEIPFAVVRPGLDKPDALMKVLHKTIDLQSKNRPANTDVRETTLEFLKRDPLEPTPDTGGIEIVGTRRDGTRWHAITLVDFRCHEIPSLPKDALPFCLERAPSPDGPWTFADGKRDKFSTGGTLTGANLAEMRDGPSVSSREPFPPFFRVGRVWISDDGKAEVKYSPVWHPSPPQISLWAPGADVPINGDNHAPKTEEPGPGMEDNFGLQLDLEGRLELADQAFLYPGAHFTINWNGRTWHVWSDRSETDRSYGSSHGNAHIDLPARFGSNALHIRAEAANGDQAERTITVEFEPPWAAARRQAADLPIDDEPSVKALLPQGEEAPAKAAVLEKHLAAETEELRKGELRYAIVKLQELALDLEEKRLGALSQRAEQSFAATDGQRAVELIGVWAQYYPSFAQRYLAYVDRCIEWGELYKGSDVANRNARYRETMVNSCQAEWLRGLRAGLKFGLRTGDYPATRYYGLKLVDAVAALPDQRIPGGDDLNSLKVRLAEAEAHLGGNRDAAARLWPNQDYPAWWPETPPSAQAGESNDQELKDLEAAVSKRAIEAATNQKIRVRPGQL